MDSKPAPGWVVRADIQATEVPRLPRRPSMPAGEISNPLVSHDSEQITNSQAKGNEFRREP